MLRYPHFPACVAIVAPITLTFMLGTGSAPAKPLCFEGRTSTGACVNAVLAEAQRKQAIANVQPRLSQQTPLYLPGEDYFYGGGVQASNAATTYIRNVRYDPVLGYHVGQTPRYVAGNRQ